jgi:SAM-dependent methyltransferase
MAKKPFDDYKLELAHQQTVWQRKASLRVIYKVWYKRIIAQLTDQRPVVEIGSGCGNFKESFPDAIATDAIDAGDWIDRVVDARDLPFGDAEIGNYVMIDVLHHLPRPLNFLRAAARTLQPGGRIVLLEPAATPWARAVFGAFHHEPIDLSQDLFVEDGTPEPSNEGFTFANQAIGTLLFVNNPSETFRRVPELRPVIVEHSDFMVYPATGGFSYLNLMPSRLVRPLYQFENRVTEKTRSKTGMRLLVVLERTETDATRIDGPGEVADHRMNT